MTISNGSTILSSDLTAGFGNPLSDLADDAATLATPFYLSFVWDSITSSTTSGFRTATYTPNDDFTLVELAISANNLNGTATVALSSDLPPGLGNPTSISVTGSVGSQVKASRLYATGSTAPFFTLLRGVQYTLTASTTDTTAPADAQSIMATLVLRAQFRRF